jgi:hypothetical protein
VMHHRRRECLPGCFLTGSASILEKSETIARSQQAGTTGFPRVPVIVETAAHGTQRGEQ